MARYYEETALIEFVKQHTPTINGETTMECVERAIRNAPTADVVPKSERERLIERVKQDLIGKIFEELDSILFLHERSHMPFSGNDYVNYYDISLKKDIERLKDKCIKNSQSL